MNYKIIYNNLIAKAKSENRKKGLDIYYEAHHIIPRCFGGEGDCRNIKHPNIVLLTTKEHYFAHLLLVEIYPTSTCMKKALWNMITVDPFKQRFIPSSSIYSLIRNEYIKSISGKNGTYYGRKHSEKTKEKIRIASTGRQSNLGKKHSEESKIKIANARKGIIISEEHKNAIRKTLYGGNCYKAKKVVCTLTNTIFGSGREVSDLTGIPFSTVRRYLNGYTKPPLTFHYKRVQ